MKYHIAQLIKGKHNWLRVEGEPVTFKGFEEFNFFISRAHDYPDYWVVSEQSTGCAVGAMQANKQYAIESAEKCLDMQGVKKIRETIDRHVRTWGSAPTIEEHRSK